MTNFLYGSFQSLLDHNMVIETSALKPIRQNCVRWRQDKNRNGVCPLLTDYSRTLPIGGISCIF
jgi:hypothetical protein